MPAVAKMLGPCPEPKSTISGWTQTNSGESIIGGHMLMLNYELWCSASFMGRFQNAPTFKNDRIP
jgi:hypothetical protein